MIFSSFRLISLATSTSMGPGRRSLVLSTVPHATGDPQGPHRGPGRPRKEPKEKEGAESEHRARPTTGHGQSETSEHGKGDAPAMDRVREGGRKGGSANTEAQQEGRSRGGHHAQEALHRGDFSGGIDLGKEVQEEIREGLASDDPMERIRAGGKKGGKITQAKFHAEDPSVIEGIHREEPHGEGRGVDHKTKKGE